MACWCGPLQVCGEEDRFCFSWSFCSLCWGGETLQMTSTPACKAWRQRMFFFGITLKKSFTDKPLLLLFSFVGQCVFIHPLLHTRLLFFWLQLVVIYTFDYIKCKCFPISFLCYTAACYSEMYVPGDRLPLLFSIHLCLVFFPSLCSAGQSSCFCSAQGLLHPNGMARRVDEYFWALCALRHHWQLCLTLSLEQRGCSRFFSFSLHFELSLPACIHHLIKHYLFYTPTV